MAITTASTRTATPSPKPTVIPTQTLLVNSAFLQEIKDSNPDLWHAMHQLRQICESDGSPTQVVRTLVRLLDDLRDQWAMQFALEESYGYVQVPLSRFSIDSLHDDRLSICEKSELAQSQHCGLYLKLRDLAEQAEELQYRGVTLEQLNRLLRTCGAFDAAVRQHEHLEQELIESCFNSSDPK